VTRLNQGRQVMSKIPQELKADKITKGKENNSNPKVTATCFG